MMVSLPATLPEPLPEWHFPVSTLGSSARPASPVRPASLDIPSRHIGHRRGGSEFIGGDGKQGGPGLMSTSPNKGDSSLPVPGANPSRRPGGRGHAHRRSAAMSCHDLSMILKPVEPEALRHGNSAPTTPCVEVTQDGVMTPVTPPVNSHKRKVSENNTPRASSEQASTRARVGFSDTLEYIPRPLSSLSSDTSTTGNTVRGHSVTGSISSVLSQTPSPAREQRTTSGSDETFSRPSTAGAILGTPSKRTISFADESSPFKRPVSASYSPKHSPFKSDWSLRKSLFSNARRVDDASPTPTPTIEKPESDCLMISDDSSVGKSEPESRQKEPVPTSSKSSVPKKFKKKSKSWSILPRRSKRHGQKAKAHRRTPTPPVRCHTSPRDISSPELNIEEFDETPPDTYILAEHLPNFPDLVPDWTSWEPRGSLRQEQSSTPIIDLDAALGPFNTPGSSPESRTPSRGGFSAAKLRMHSSGNTGGFMGPGMHYHRRTESAPEMQPLDRGYFNMNRLGSRSTMDDVFEEEEEDEYSSKPPQSPVKSEREEDESVGMGIAVVEEEKWDIQDPLPKAMGTLGELGDSQRGLKHKGSGLSDDEFQPSFESPHMPPQSTSIVDETIPEETSPVEKTDDFRLSFITKASDETVTPRIIRDDERVLGNSYLDLPSPNPPFMIPDVSSTTSSPLPSPEFAPSTFEAPTHPTAASSFTDEQHSSPFFGPTLSDMRISVDDVPSLTSSNSTMTTPHATGCRTPGQRSASISSAITARSSYRFSTGKRGSIVSLSRLVGSSHGEKSKLSIEARAPDSPEKPKESKHKRFSRMMQFWKAKETQI